MSSLSTAHTYHAEPCLPSQVMLLTPTRETTTVPTSLSRSVFRTSEREATALGISMLTQRQTTSLLGAESTPGERDTDLGAA